MLRYSLLIIYSFILLGCSEDRVPQTIGKARADIGLMRSSMDLYYMDFNRYPSTEQGFDALLTRPSDLPNPAKWNGPYINNKSRLIDSWGMPYQYLSPGKHNPDRYDLWSCGPDRISGTADDIVNWDK